MFYLVVSLFSVLSIDQSMSISPLISSVTILSPVLSASVSTFLSTVHVLPCDASQYLLDVPSSVVNCISVVAQSVFVPVFLYLLDHFVTVTSIVTPAVTAACIPLSLLSVVLQCHQYCDHHHHISNCHCWFIRTVLSFTFYLVVFVQYCTAIPVLPVAFTVPTVCPFISLYCTAVHCT